MALSEKVLSFGAGCSNIYLVVASRTEYKKVTTISLVSAEEFSCLVARRATVVSRSGEQPAPCHSVLGYWGWCFGLAIQGEIPGDPTVYGFW